MKIEMKKSIKERLEKKTLNQLYAISKRIKYPVRGNKQEIVRDLNYYLTRQFQKNWDAIAGA